MKRILIAVILLFAIASLFTIDFEDYLYYSSCSEPVGYKIGEIDPAFEVSKDDLRIYSENAAKIWNDEWNGKLLQYDPFAELSINLVFDERQELTSKINLSKNELEKNNKAIELQINEYEREIARLEQRINVLNEEIEYWNKNGGAPEDVYNELIKEQSDVLNEIERINTKAYELDSKTTNYNYEVANLNDNVADFNNLLEAKPEEGLYMPAEQRIEVYIVNNELTLTHTIAHEFGHALGIEHVEDSASLMYATVSNAIELSEKDKVALIEVCRTKNRLKEAFSNFARFYNLQK